MTGDDTTKVIKEKLDIVDFLKSYLTLIPAGKNFKALCPFHKEKTPSFMVSADRQTWHCFGSCNTGGDIFTFLMRYENIEFFEALKALAEKAQVELRHVDPAVAREFGVLYDIHVTAKEFFRRLLSENEEVLRYALGRGLTKETINEFELGFAPMGRDTLTVFLLNQRFQVGDILRSGLAIRGDRGGYYDRFRGRLIFPLYDHFGKVVGFTGRILPLYDDDTTPKYINSPETPIFKKSKLFYGFHKAKQAIRETKTAFLVEGQMDFLLAMQDGVKNVLATSGTALTEDHLVFLRRQAETLFICFDADEAGGAAADRALQMAGAHDFETKVVELQDSAKDPAEYVVAHPGKLGGLLQGALSYTEFYFLRYLTGQFNKKNIQIVLQKIRTLASAIDRAQGLAELSNRVGIPERDLREEFDRLEASSVIWKDEKASGEPEKVADIKPKERRSLIAENLIRLALAKNDMKIAEDAREYLPLYYQEMLAAIVGGSADKELQKNIDFLALQSDFMLTHSTEDLCAELKLEYLIEEKGKLSQTITGLERSGKSTELENAIKKFDLLSREIHNLKN